MVHVADLNPAHYEDTIMTPGPVLNLEGLFMKPLSALPTPTPLGDDDDTTLINLHPHHEDHLPKGILETEEEKTRHWFVGSIDQGTTSSRFLIFNGEGDPVATHQIEFENLYPKSGYVPFPLRNGSTGLHRSCGSLCIITELTNANQDGTSKTPTSFLARWKHVSRVR